MFCSIKQYLKDGTTVKEASSEVSLEALSCFAFAETQHIRQDVAFLMKTCLVLNENLYFQVRRVSFADPIYQAGLADDIDRRCSVARPHSSNSSPLVKNAKTSPTSHSKVSYRL